MGEGSILSSDRVEVDGEASDKGHPNAGGEGAAGHSILCSLVTKLSGVCLSQCDKCHTECLHYQHLSTQTLGFTLSNSGNMHSHTMCAIVV